MKVVMHIVVFVVSFAVIAQGLNHDAKPSASRDRFDIRVAALGDQDAQRAQVIYCATVFTVGTCLSCIFYDRSRGTIISILAYVFALSSMSVTMKNVYVNHQFNYPQFITATHFLATGITGLVILLVRRASSGAPIAVPSPSLFAKGIVPIALAFAFSIGFANTGLLYCSAHFVEIIGASTMLVTAGIGVLMGKPFPLKLMPPMLLVFVGVLIVSVGEVHFSLAGFLCILFAVFLRAVKVQRQHTLMFTSSTSQALDPIEMVFWTSISCFAIMASWSLTADGLAPFKEIIVPRTFAAVLLTMVLATFLQISALYVLKEFGPVAQQIIGNLKGMIACVGAMAALGEVITLQQKVGYGVLLVGVVCYNQQNKAINEHQKKGERREKGPTGSERDALLGETKV